MTGETVILIASDVSPFVRIALITGAAIMRQIGMKLTVAESPGTWLSRFDAETPVPPPV